MITFSIDDINKETAERAYNGTSFSPEKRGELRRKEYAEHMQWVVEKFSPWATEENAEQLGEELEAYRAKYARLLADYLHSHSRVMSTMITGPANFPTNSNRKKGDAADKKMTALFEWSQKRLDKLERKYNPRIIANAPIMSGDADALDKLRAKLASLERTQELMKTCNKIVRSKEFKALDYDAQVNRLQEVTGWKAGTIHEILKPYMGSIGFQSFTLTNNNANIKRVRDRIAQLEKLATKEATSQERPDGITIERDPEAVRIRLIFPGKPDAATRALLKSNGFRWAPSVGAWQRQLNSNGEYAAKRVLAALASAGGE